VRSTPRSYNTGVERKQDYKLRRVHPALALALALLINVGVAVADELTSIYDSAGNPLLAAITSAISTLAVFFGGMLLSSWLRGRLSFAEAIAVAALFLVAIVSPSFFRQFGVQHYRFDAPLIVVAAALGIAAGRGLPVPTDRWDKGP
jgi:hypothetical protein